MVFINENKFVPIKQNPTGKYEQQIKQLPVIKIFTKLFHNNDSNKINKDHISRISYKWVHNSPSLPTMKALLKFTKKTLQ